MNAKALFIAALSIVAATAALAHEVTPDTFSNVKSTLTRAEVVREYVRARDAGEIASANVGFTAPHLQRAMQ